MKPGKMAGKVLPLFSAALCFLPLFSSPLKAEEAIVTGNKTGTYYAIGEDLSKFVMPELKVNPSNGSIDNIKALSKSAGVSFAIVQSDVYQAYVHLAKEDQDPAIRAWANDLLGSLRVVMPLYDEEIYFIVHKSSPIKSIFYIQGKRLAIGPAGSGSNLTAKNIYKKLFGTVPVIVEPFVENGVTGDDEGTKIRRSALWRLAHPEMGPDNRKVDVVVAVGGQPIALLAKLGPDYRALTIDPQDPKIQALLKDYKVGTLYKKNYGLLEKDEPALAVPSYLITARFRSSVRNEMLRDFATSLCNNYGKLYEQGHQKWQSLNWKPSSSSLPVLANGWVYSEVTTPVLESCHNSSQSVETSSPLPCAVEDRAIGLCQ